MIITNKKKHILMEKEILVALIAAIASFIVGIINMIFNARISSKQNEIELKKTRVEILENRSQKIEKIRYEISNRTMDLGNDMFDINKHFPIFLNFYHKNASGIFSIGHLLDEKYVSELRNLSQRISDNTMKSKLGENISDDETRFVYNKMRELGNQMQDQLNNSLFNIEQDIKTLLKK